MKDDPQVIEIKQGYSKDHRPDFETSCTFSRLPMVRVSMPLWMEALDGNSSDKASFQ